MARARRGQLFLSPDVGHQRFRGQHQCGDRCGVLQRQVGDLGGIDHSSLEHITVLTSLRIEAAVLVLRIAHAPNKPQRLRGRR